MEKRPASLSSEIWESVEDKARREVLAAISVLESEEDPDFDRLTRLAALTFGTPMALIKLVDVERQWFKSSYGLDLRETPIGISFSAHVIAQRDVPYMVVPDASKDPRFAHHPLVTGTPHVRFYAGAPISVRGQRLGALCVMAPVARDSVDETQLEQLVDLAQVAGSLFELKDEARVRALTAADLIREEWRHALTLEAGKVGSWVWDVRTGDVVANDILRRMFGLDPLSPFKVDDVFGAIHPEDLAGVQEALDATFEEGVDYTSEFRVAATGRWLIGRGRVYQRDAGGRPLVMMGVNIDITEARESADQMRLLLRELNHRVKNTLAMIQSLARQTLNQSPDPQHFVDAFSGRLRTLSDAHVLLSDRDWSGIGLLELIQSQVGPYLLASPRQLEINGPDLRLPPDHALGLGLVLHELSSNAVKFGALSRPQGLVRISWRERGGKHPHVDLTWKESGGPVVRAPGEPGLGSRLIQRSLDKVLGSRVELAFPDDGVEARISFPLA